MPKHSSWRLPHHSFERTLSYDDTLGLWTASACTMALRDRLQLIPFVPNRYGFFWNSKPISTRDFEIRFTFSASQGPVSTSNRDGKFVFWLSPENLISSYNETTIVAEESKDWAKGLAKEGLTLLSNKPTFKGLALTFADGSTPAISALWNDGTSRAMQDLTSPSSGAQMKAVDWETGQSEVKVRVNPDGSLSGSIRTVDIRAHLVGSTWDFVHHAMSILLTLTFEANGRINVQAAGQSSPDNTINSGTWKFETGNTLELKLGEHTFSVRFEGSTYATIAKPASEPRGSLHLTSSDFASSHEGELFSLPAGTVPRGEVFIGFTAFSGTESPIEVNLHRLETMNFDEEVAGEDESDLLVGDDADWLKVLAEEKRYLDQASQSEAVQHLTALVSSFASRAELETRHFKERLIEAEKKLDTVGLDMANYLAATRAYSFDSNKFDPSTILSHIAGIRTLLTGSKASHEQKLGNVQQAAVELKKKGMSTLSDTGKKHVKSLQEQSDLVNELATMGSWQTNLMLLILVGAVALLAFLFFNRMRYYEKRHFF